MITWEKLSTYQTMTTTGMRLQEGRYLYVTQGKDSRLYPAKACFCIFDEGQWFDDTGEELPYWMTILYICTNSIKIPC